ncbi:MAG: extracellular solute-binding protein [Patescibacteria group bacterium]
MLTKSKQRLFSAFLFFPLMLSFNFSDIPLIGRFFKDKANLVSSSDKVELTYWGLFETEETLNPLISAYEKTHPNIKINYEPKDFNDLKSYKETLQARLKNNTAPDIIRMHSSWVPEFYPYLKPAPNTAFTKETYLKEFFPAAESCCVSSKGEAYAVPLMYEALVVFYNQDILSEEGINRLPKTWDDFRELAIALTKKDERGNIIRAGAAIGNSKNIAHSSDILGLMWSQSNVKIPEDLDSDAAANVLDYYVSFFKTDRVWDNWLPYSPIAFAEEKVAIMFAPTWQSFSILNSNPNSHIGISAVPQIPIWQSPGITNINWASFWVEGVPKSSKNSNAAWEFLKFLSQKEQRDKLFKESARIRPFGNSFGLNALSETLRNVDYITNVVLGAPNAKSGIIADRVGNNLYVDAINKAVDTVLSGKTSKEALLDAKKTIIDAQKDSQLK